MRGNASLLNIKKNVIGYQAISIGFVEVVVYNLRQSYAQSTPNLGPTYAQARFCLQSKQGVTGWMKVDVSLVNIKKNMIGYQAISIGFVKVVVHNLRPIYGQTTPNYAQSTPNLRPIYAQSTPNLRPTYAQVDVLWKLSRELQGQIGTHQMAKKTQRTLGYDK